MQTWQPRIWWVGLAGSVVLMVGLVWRWYSTIQDRQLGLAAISPGSQPTPTLPPFIIDHSQQAPRLSTSAAQTLPVSGKGLLRFLGLGSVDTQTDQVLSAKTTPTSLEPLSATSLWNVPYIRGSDLWLNQAGQERLILKGQSATATQSAVRYVFPMVSPNGALVAFFEQVSPAHTLPNSVGPTFLKVLDSTTGQIHTTPYRFVASALNPDRDWPVRWNSRDWLEIIWQRGPTEVVHSLYDPDRKIEVAKQALLELTKTPWATQSARAVLPGFSIDSDGTNYVEVDERQFWLAQVGQQQRTPLEIPEMAQGQRVWLYGWVDGDIYFVVEQTTYQACLNQLPQAPTSTQTDVLTNCFADHHYLLVFDGVSGAVKRRWYNFQIGQSQQSRWVQFVRFLDSAALNHRDEVIYFQPHLPLLLVSTTQPVVSTSFDGQRAVVITNQAAQLHTKDGSVVDLALGSGVTLATLKESRYHFVWTGANRFLIAYPQHQTTPQTGSVVLVDTQLQQVQLVQSQVSW